MEAYANEYKDWDGAVLPCRLVSVEMDGNGNIVIHDGIDAKTPCTSFNKAYCSANGAYICLDPMDRRPAKSFWPALKKAMAEDIRSDIDIVDGKIKELRLEKAKLKQTLARTRKLKLQ